MKPKLIAAGAAVAAAGAAVAAAGVLSLAIPAGHNIHHDEVALVDTTLNDTVLSLEGVTPYTQLTEPLGETPATGLNGDFYNVYASDTGGTFTGSGATDLLNSSDIIGANKLAGLGDTNGYIGLSPTTTPGDFTFNDAQGVDFDHGLQALLTAYNAPLISYEDTLSTNTLGDPSLLNLDPAELSNSAAANLFGDLTVAYNDFVNAADLAFGITP
jgi:hypothetical protein